MTPIQTYNVSRQMILNAVQQATDKTHNVEVVYFALQSVADSVLVSIKEEYEKYYETKEQEYVEEITKLNRKIESLETGAMLEQTKN